MIFGPSIVSSYPYICTYDLKLPGHKFIVVATDGLWLVMTPRAVVDFIWSKITMSSILNTSLTSVNCARLLVKEALKRWEVARKPADNITVVVIIMQEVVEPNINQADDQVVPEFV